MVQIVRASVSSGGARGFVYPYVSIRKGDVACDTCGGAISGAPLRCVFCVWLRCNAARCFVGDSVRRVPVLFPLICYVIGCRWSMHAAYAFETSVVPKERPSCDGGIGDAISRRCGSCTAHLQVMTRVCHVMSAEQSAEPPTHIIHSCLPRWQV